MNQYGGAWTLVPYMYRAGGRWVHRWAVAPRFAGYASGPAGFSVVWTPAELRRLGRRSLLDEFRGLFD